MVLVVSALISCMGSGYVNQMVFQHLDDVDRVKELNWCRFLIDSLVETHDKWRRGELQRFTGLILFLTVQFYERTVPRAVLVLIGWTTELLRDREFREIRSGGFRLGEIDPPFTPVDDAVPGSSRDLPKSLFERVAEKTAELASVILELVKLANEASVGSFDNVNMRQFFDAAHLLMGLKDSQAAGLFASQPAEPSFTQQDDAFWADPENLRKVEEIEWAFIGRSSLKDMPSFSLGMTQDLNDDIWAGVGNIAREVNCGVNDAGVFSVDPHVAGSPVQAADGDSGGHQDVSGREGVGGMNGEDVGVHEEPLVSHVRAVYADGRLHQDVSDCEGVGGMDGEYLGVHEEPLVGSGAVGVNMSEFGQGEIAEDAVDVVSLERDGRPHGGVRVNDLVHFNSPFTPAVGDVVDGTTVAGVSDPVCGSPVKVDRPHRSQLTIALFKGYASDPSVRDIVPLPQMDDPEESVVCRWVLEVGHQYLDEELFCFRGRSVRREDLRSLAPGLHVHVAVVDDWSCILNCRELRKDSAAPSRFFASMFTTCNTVVQVSHDRDQWFVWFRDRLIQDFAISLYRDWKNIEMFVFPIIDKSHFYMLCVDFCSNRLEIIDNSSALQTNKNKYGNAPKILKDMLFGFLLHVGEYAKAAATKTFVAQRMQMVWRDSKNKVDCGVFLMRHMETYVGQGVGAWECGLFRGDLDGLMCLRFRYMKEIVVAEMNVHRLRNIACAIQFVSTPLATIRGLILCCFFFFFFFYLGLAVVYFGFGLVFGATCKLVIIYYN